MLVMIVAAGLVAPRVGFAVLLIRGRLWAAFAGLVLGLQAVPGFHVKSYATYSLAGVQDLVTLEAFADVLTISHKL